MYIKLLSVGLLAIIIFPFQKIRKFTQEMKIFKGLSPENIFLFWFSFFQFFFFNIENYEKRHNTWKHNNRENYKEQNTTLLYNFPHSGQTIIMEIQQLNMVLLIKIKNHTIINIKFICVVIFFFNQNSFYDKNDCPYKAFCNWKRYGQRHNLYIRMELDKLFMGPKFLISLSEIEKESDRTFHNQQLMIFLNILIIIPH